MATLLARVQADLDAHSTARESLEIQLREAQVAISNLAGYKLKARERKGQLKQYEAALIRTRQKHDEALAEIVRQREVITGLQEVFGLKEEVERALHSSEAAVARLNAELLWTREESATRLHERDGALLEADRLLTELSQARAAHEVHLGNAREERLRSEEVSGVLKRETAALKEQLQTFEIDTARQSRELQRAREQNSLWQQEREGLLSERDSLRDRLTAAIEEQDRKTLEAISLGERVEQQALLLEREQKAREAAERERDIWHGQADELRAEIRAIKEQLEARRVHQVTVQDELAQLRSKAESLETELAAARHEIDNLAVMRSSQYEDEQMSYGDLQNAWEGARAEAEDARRRAEVAERAGTAAGHRAALLETELKKLRDGLAPQPLLGSSSTLTTVSSTGPEIETLTAQLKEARFQADRFHSILNNLGIKVS
jgi:hypothetical protein